MVGWFSWIYAKKMGSMLLNIISKSQKKICGAINSVRFSHYIFPLHLLVTTIIAKLLVAVERGVGCTSIVALYDIYACATDMASLIGILVSTFPPLSLV